MVMNRLQLSAIAFSIWFALPCLAQGIYSSTNTTNSTTKHSWTKFKYLTTATSNSSSFVMATTSIASTSTSASSTSFPVAMPLNTSSAVPFPTIVPTNYDGSSWKGHPYRNLPAIIVATILGTMLLILLGILIWQYAARRERRAFLRRTPSPDEGEFERWRQPTLPSTSASEEELKPKAELRPMSQTHSTERYYRVLRPRPSHQVDTPLGSPTSSSGLLQDANPFDDQMYEYRELLSYRHSLNSTSAPAQPRPESRRSMNSSHIRPPTPLFGSGKTLGETNSDAWVNPRKSVDPRPRSIARSPLSNSPITSEFDFGFEPKPVIQRSERSSAGALRSLVEAKAPQLI